MDPPTPPPPTPAAALPANILLGIVARSDVTTVIRCAATSTRLRTAILDPSFLRRIHLHPAAVRRFDAARLLAVSYSSGDYGGNGIVQLRRPLRARLESSLLQAPFEPVSSRDGLLVLRRRGTDNSKPPELRVCNTFSGHVTKLPPMAVPLHHELACDNYRPAVLTTGGGDGSFEVLVMDAHLRVQIFSSKDGRWCGAVRTVAPPPAHRSLKPYALQTSPTVIGRTVHYLCHSSSKPSFGPGDDMFVLAVHADEGQATSIELPEGCVSGDKESCNLAVTADGRRLSVLVADAEAIVVWALSSPEKKDGWSRQAVIGRRGIHEQVAAGDKVAGKVAFQGFGERSGAVLLQMDMVGLVLLNMQTEKAVLLRGCGELDRRAYQHERAWLHEIDLASLLQGMKDFRHEGELARFFKAMRKKTGGEIVARTMKISSGGEIVARKEAPIIKFHARWRVA